MSSSILPRRSPRLAANSQPTTPTPIPATATNPPLIKEEATCKLTPEAARNIFLEKPTAPIAKEYKQKCTDIIQAFLAAAEEARGKTAKAVITTALAQFLVQNPTFLRAYRRFAEKVQAKMAFLAQEKPLLDAVVDATFRKAMRDILFVVNGA